MDVLQIIRNEHREVASLLDQVEELDPGDEQLRQIATQVQEKLSLHLAIEERLFYNELRRRAEESDEQVDIFEAYTEHELAKQLLAMLKGGRKTDERFKAELQVLGESVKHHVEDEESNVFKLAKEVLETDEREEIGQAWERAKKRGQPSTATTRPKASRRSASSARS
jgi:hemerythrin-like domain-containing protein